jgi:hypothetical protein
MVMPRYKVLFSQKTDYVYEVEAEDINDAEDKALSDGTVTDETTWALELEEVYELD